MRWLICVFVMGCSSSEASAGDSGLADSASIDSADVADGSPRDTWVGISETAIPTCMPGAVNTLVGTFPTGSSTSEPAWEAKTVLRIDRASAPGRPFVIFLSKPVTCSAFTAKQWTEHIDSARFLYVEFGASALATYPPGEEDPPPATRSFIAHGSGNETGGVAFPTQFTEDGAATLTASSSMSIAGTFAAGFVGDPAKPLFWVCGRFDTTACAVPW